MLSNSFGIMIYDLLFTGNVGKQEEFIYSNHLMNGIYTLVIEHEGNMFTQKFGISK
jgi:hemin uptake protein HemP